MSYNIDSANVLKCDAWMLAADIGELLAKHEDELPSDCFLHEMAEKEPDAEGRVLIGDDFAWRSEGSGNSWREVFLPHVAPKIHGTLEAVLTWEGGDSHSGLRIRDGKVTEPNVVMALEDE